MSGHKALTGLKDVACRHGHVQVLFLARDQHAKNSTRSSVPTDGVSSGAPTAAKCTGVSGSPDTVKTPTR